MLTIYNSQTRKKELFKPINEGKITMYVCGMTVYDFCHLGHARVMVNFDMITRYLRSRGYDLTYVRNITDIDDKIIARANENHERFEEVTERFIKAMHEDERQLGILPPDSEPRATQHLDDILALIQALIDKGFAYVAENGDIYYQVNKFDKYGKLSNQNLEMLHSGVRIEVENAKRDPFDFVLWKMAKPNEPSWPSPWGPGRPGWHIECSAMSMKALGQTFDIHGGGPDLIFPHHENEMAQSEGATGKPFVNYWMHLGAVEVDKKKMSKSLGNFFTIRDILKNHHPEAVRYFLLASHYRSPLNYTEEALNEAYAALERLYLSLRDLPKAISEEIDPNQYEQRFIDAMDDDFNTPIAFSILFEISREINKCREHSLDKAAQLGLLLKRLASTMGMLQTNPNTFLQGIHDQVDKIAALISLREKARLEKNWMLSDELRNRLHELGIELEDKPDGTTVWRRQ